MNGDTSKPLGLHSRELTIVADDLTGALDTAGCFATPENPVHVLLAPPLPRFGRNALDTDSRDLAEEDAVRRVAQVFQGLSDVGDDRIVFKKIDSVMRGHPIAEAVAAFRGGRFERALFAPAFPAAGRVTIAGQQRLVTPSGTEAAGPYIVKALRAHGIAAHMLDGNEPDHGFYVADATRQSDLDAAVDLFGINGRSLFVGTAGLAAALAVRTVPDIDVPRIEIAICGTLHPVTRAQIDAVDRSRVEEFILDGRSDPIPQDRCIFVAPQSPRNRDEVAFAIAHSMERLVNERRGPGTALVTGGWTLRLLCRICRTGELLCLGSCAPGIAICRMVGGLWDGTVIISKSGGFGGQRLLSDLFAGS